jgi:ATP-dependent DNA ligase
LRERDRVRLITRGDWTKRHPWITEAARKVRRKKFVTDGEALILGVASRANAVEQRGTEAPRL